MSFHWDQTPPPPAWTPSDDRQTFWQKKLERARATPGAGLLLGSNLTSSLPVFITPEILRTHMHVLGSTGVGKSFFLEALIKSLILQGYGVAVIDPHGDLYNRLLAFCSWLNLQKPEIELHRRVIPFDVGETRDVIGFNPVSRNARVLT